MHVKYHSNNIKKNHLKLCKKFECKKNSSFQAVIKFKFHLLSPTKEIFPLQAISEITFLYCCNKFMVSGFCDRVLNFSYTRNFITHDSLLQTTEKKLPEQNRYFQNKGKARKF